MANRLEEAKDKFSKSLKEKEENFNKNVKSGVKKTGNFLKKLLVVLLIAGIAAIGVYFLYTNYTFSEGTRAGNLIKISKKGILFKTYEGQLKMGGIDLENQGESLSDTWSFSVKDRDIVKKLEKLQGEKVILRYKEINKAMPWQGDTNYFITDIEQ